MTTQKEALLKQVLYTFLVAIPLAVFLTLLFSFTTTRYFCRPYCEMEGILLLLLSGLAGTILTAIIAPLLAAVFNFQQLKNLPLRKRILVVFFPLLLGVGFLFLYLLQLILRSRLPF